MNKNRVLVTGVNGFVGEHTAQHFSELGYDVTGTGRQDNPDTDVSPFLDDYVQADLLDEDSLRKIGFSTLNAIIHLGGRSAVGESFQKPHEYLTENSIMTYNVHNQAKEANFKGRIVSVSTGALYDPNQPLPLTEQSRTASNSPYAVGKLAAEAVAQYFQTSVDTIIARPFNHIGPGQGKGFLLPDMYTQMLAAGDAISVGNLETRRDYTDVRDIARAYGRLVAVEKLNHTVYNVCSDNSKSGLQILQIIKNVTGLSGIEAIVDPSRLRPNEIMNITGDYARLRADTGWSPKIDLDQTVADFVQRQSVC